jgi:hypothetical protein
MNYFINMIAADELREAVKLETAYIEAEIAGYWGTGQKLRKQCQAKRNEAYQKIRLAHKEANLPFNSRKTSQMCKLV